MFLYDDEYEIIENAFLLMKIYFLFSWKWAYSWPAWWIELAKNKPIQPHLQDIRVVYFQKHRLWQRIPFLNRTDSKCWRKSLSTSERNFDQVLLWWMSAYVWMSGGKSTLSSQTLYKVKIEQRNSLRDTFLKLVPPGIQPTDNRSAIELQVHFDCETNYQSRLESQLHHCRFPNSSLPDISPHSEVHELNKLIARSHNLPLHFLPHDDDFNLDSLKSSYGR